MIQFVLVGLLGILLSQSNIHCVPNYPYRQRDLYRNPLYWDHTTPYYYPQTYPGYYPQYQYPYYPYGRPSWPYIPQYPYWNAPKTATRTVPYPPLIPPTRDIGQDLYTWPFTYYPVMPPSTPLPYSGVPETPQPTPPVAVAPTQEPVAAPLSPTSYLDQLSTMIWHGGNLIPATHEPIVAESRSNSKLRKANRGQRLIQAVDSGKKLNQTANLMQVKI